MSNSKSGKSTDFRVPDFGSVAYVERHKLTSRRRGVTREQFCFTYDLVAEADRDLLKQGALHYTVEAGSVEFGKFTNGPHKGRPKLVMTIPMSVAEANAVHHVNAVISTILETMRQHVEVQLRLNESNGSPRDPQDTVRRPLGLVRPTFTSAK